jgi:O-antigen ligase
MENKIGKHEYLIIILCVLTALLTKSSTAIVSIFSFLFILGIELKTKMNLFSNWKRWGLLYGIVLIQIMFVRGNMIFSWIISLFFNKTLSYTGRDSLWNRAYEMISEKPIIGYGRIEGDYISIWGGLYSAHNFILELLLQGGGIALLIFIYMVIQTLKKLQRNRLNKVTKVLWIALFITLIAMLMEANVHSVYLFGLLVFAYRSTIFEDLAVGKEFFDEAKIVRDL